MEAELASLKEQLKKANEKVSDLEAQNVKLKKSVIDVQTNAEREEEHIANKLLKRIEELKAEKQKLLQQVEIEEDYLANTLKKQLEQARKEKILLENSMEKEQEYVVNKLRKEISKLNATRERSLSDPNETKIVKDLKAKVAELEQQIKALRFDVETEKGRNKILQGHIESLRAASVEIQATAEQQEEYISNTLLKRISGLKKEKEALLVQVENEEEYLTNMLNKKVSKLIEEKQALEAALESGQSRMVDHLQKRLDIVRSNSPVVDLPYTRPDDTDDISELKKSLGILEDQYNSTQLQLHSAKDNNKTLQNQLRDLKNENLLLKQRHQYELEKIANIGMEKVQLEKDLEITEERQFNLYLEPPMEVRTRSFSTPIIGGSHNLRKSPSNPGSSPIIPTLNSNSAPNVNSLNALSLGVNTSGNTSPPFNGNFSSSSHSSPSTSPVGSPPNGLPNSRSKKAAKSAEEIQGY